MNIQELRSAIEYEPISGTFTRLKSSGNVLAGKTIETSEKNAYVHICIDGVNFKAHRLAWILTYGSIPENKLIDHINRNKSDNRLENLRLTDYFGNARNTERKRTSKSRFIGVVPRKKKWEARIRDGENQVYLGTFFSQEEAAFIYDMASIKIHGDFGIRNFLPLVI